MDSFTLHNIPLDPGLLFFSSISPFYLYFWILYFFFFLAIVLITLFFFHAISKKLFLSSLRSWMYICIYICIAFPCKNHSRFVGDEVFPIQFECSFCKHFQVFGQKSMLISFQNLKHFHLNANFLSLHICIFSHMFFMYCETIYISFLSTTFWNVEPSQCRELYVHLT